MITFTHRIFKFLKTNLRCFQEAIKLASCFIGQQWKKINKEKRSSKNYVLFLGKNDTESNQQPCLSLIQFQIDQGKLAVSAYQRSSDANLGLPADIYHLYLISRQIELPLKSITLFLGNVHVYESNLEGTEKLLAGENVKFTLNVG